MRKLCQISGMSEDQTFEYIVNNLKGKLTNWDYYVNWEKVLSNIEPIEQELCLLNSLIGKSDFLTEAKNLIIEYPNVIKAIPALLAIRAKSVEILIDATNFIYRHFDFTIRKPDEQEAGNFAEFIEKAGLGDLIKNKRIKNLVDYVTGVEVGLDSNGRKNRGGSLMEALVETFVAKVCKKSGAQYVPQATAKKIDIQWNIAVEEDKSSRKVDFAINKNGKLFFIETNFYGGGGSKLKSTATEYIQMNNYWNNQGIAFVWITDGAGWQATKRPLREYYDKADFLLNLDMLQKGYLEKIIV